MSRTVQVVEVPGVEEAIGSRDPVGCAARISEILGAGADPKEVVRTAALAAARHFAPRLPPPHALPALAASLDLAAKSGPRHLPVLQACALAASEWGAEPLEGARHSVSGDEIHLGRSFLLAVQGRHALEADAVFSGLLREGEERRLAGDVLFDACARDAAGQGHKLTFAVGSWRLARALGWTRGPALLRPAVHVAAGTPQDIAEYGAMLREVGRSRFDLELAGRNAAPVEAVARNSFAAALAAGPDRVVADLISGLKRGRSPAGYADLVAATAAERFIGNPPAVETVLRAMAARFVVGFSRTPSHILAVLLAARDLARVPDADVPSPARISDPEAALTELEIAIEGSDPWRAAGLAMGLADVVEARDVERVLSRQASLEDAHADAGHRLLYAAGAFDLAAVAPATAYGSMAAMLARTRRSRTVAGALGL